MSEVTATSGVLSAGNTVDTMASVNRDDLAAAAEPVSASITTEDAGTVELPVGGDAETDPLDDENTFDVSRAEFNELREAFLRLVDRIDVHNTGAPHKI